MFKINEHTGALIKKAARLFERVANQNLDQLGVTYSQCIFLVRLWEQDGQTQKELTQSAGLKQPSVVDILSRMERDELITRVQNPKDKRSYHFFLTAKAKKACEKLEQQCILMQDITTENFKQEEITAVNQVMTRIIENLDKYLIDD